MQVREALIGSFAPSHPNTRHHCAKVSRVPMSCRNADAVASMATRSAFAIQADPIKLQQAYVDASDTGLQREPHCESQLTLSIAPIPSATLAPPSISGQ